MDCAASSALVLFTQNYIVHQVNVFIHADTLRSATALMSVHCACVSELLEQPVNATFRPSFVQKFFRQLSRIISLQLIIFLIRILSSLLKTMFTNNAVTYDVWDDITSDCQIKYVKGHGHEINYGTILSGNNFNFMIFLTPKEF